MTACIHGEVCREYLRQRRGIICQTCPTGCRFYEPEERTCHMERASGYFNTKVITWFCSECGSPIYNDVEPSFCLYCGARVIDE